MRARHLRAHFGRSAGAGALMSCARRKLRRRRATAGAVSVQRASPFLCSVHANQTVAETSPPPTTIATLRQTQTLDYKWRRVSSKDNSGGGGGHFLSGEGARLLCAAARPVVPSRAITAAAPCAPHSRAHTHTHTHSHDVRRAQKLNPTAALITQPRRKLPAAPKRVAICAIQLAGAICYSKKKNLPASRLLGGKAPPPRTTCTAIYVQFKSN